jgi:DNA-binding transcriptional regulator/RsmH inhibitor MraZ
MMDNAIADAQRNNKEICLISTNTGIEIWQKTKQKQAQTTTEQQ